VPNLNEHLSTSRDNEALAERLVHMGEFGWAVTCLFYSALHLVEAYLVSVNLTSSNHRDRHTAMQRVPALQSVFRRYNHLKQQSENSRYQCQQFSRNAFVSVRDTDYRPLVSYLRNLVTA
jgi:hypothetical protein